VHEASAAVSGSVFDDEVAVEENCLALSQEAGIAVEVIPANLDHADLVVGEILNNVVKDVRGGNEIGIENGDELAAGFLQPGGESAGFVTGAVLAMDVFDGMTQGGHLFAGLAGDVGGVVGAVVENLDFQFFFWVVNEAGSLDDALGNDVFVKHRQLDGDAGEFVEAIFGLITVVAVLEVEINQEITMQAIDGDDAQDG